MNSSKQVEGTREVCVEAWNMIFGRAVFVYLFLPRSWITGYQLNDPLVTNRFLYKDRVWVGSGEIECLISREHGQQKHPDLDFRTKILVDLKKGFPTPPSPQSLRKQAVKKGREVVDCGELHTGGHSGSYILWKSYRPRFGIFGSPRLNAQLQGFIPCEETSRLIEVIWTSPTPSLVIDQSEVLIEALNSILCHGHDIESYEDNIL